MLKRPRRNRRTETIRDLVQESFLLKKDLVAPFFVLPGQGKKEPILSMPGVYRLSLDFLLPELEMLQMQGLRAAALFPVVPKELKNAQAGEALNPNGLIPQAIYQIKKRLPSLALIADVALDPFTSHGHDGIASDKGEILNDETVSLLAKMSLILAQAGVDFVAPSDMMDGRIKAIREALDHANLKNTGIIAYTAKYASTLYTPFRDALHSSLSFGDKKSYQMNPANWREALLEAELDSEEGADILMVKPALFYLDVLARLRTHTHLPLCAYHVSGEYAMVMAAAEKGYLDADKVFFEALLSIKRAGADFIFSYAAPRLLALLD